MSNILLIKISPPPKNKALFLKVVFISILVAFEIFFIPKKAYLQNTELIYVKRFLCPVNQAGCPFVYKHYIPC